MASISDEVLNEVNNEIRDIINWIAVFENEYDLPKEVVDQLRSRLEGISQKLGLETL